MTNYLKLLLVIIVALTIGACNDKNEPNDNSIIGSWYGTRTYYNPVGGTKYQYISMSFETNGTGTLEYESPVSYAVAKFVYKINGNKITCNGAYANTYGDVESDFAMTLAIEGDRLIPINKYQQFILTRDNSIITDGDGNEIIDQSDLLQRVWVSTSGETVVLFQESTYIEYVLSSPFSKTFINSNEKSYSYNAARKLINIDGTQFDILLLTSTSLSLKSQTSGVIHNYNIGSESDIPKREEDNGGNNNENNSTILSNLTSISAQTYFYETLESVVNNLKFDKKGRVIQYEDNYGYIITYNYELNEIVRKQVHESRDSWQSDTYKLSNGLVYKLTRIEKNMHGKSRDTETTFSYNGNKVTLIQEKFNSTNVEFSLVWNSNGDISETTTNSSASRLIKKYSYTYSLSETFMPQFTPYGCQSDYYTTWMDPFLWVEGYFGELPKHIMKSMYAAYSYDGYKFNGDRQINIYTSLDNNKRISRQVFNELNLESKETQSNIIQFFWK